MVTILPSLQNVEDLLPLAPWTEALAGAFVNSSSYLNETALIQSHTE